MARVYEKGQKAAPLSIKKKKNENYARCPRDETGIPFPKTKINRKV